MTLELRPDDNFKNTTAFQSRFWLLLEHMASAVYRWISIEQRIVDAISDIENTPPGRRSVKFKDMLIDSFAPVQDAPNHWKYVCKEAIRTSGDPEASWANKDGGATVDAFNDWEAHNDGVNEEGMGVNISSSSTPSTLVMLPIMVGVKVTVWQRTAFNGEVYYSFEAPNAYQVTCNVGGGIVPKQG